MGQPAVTTDRQRPSRLPMAPDTIRLAVDRSLRHPRPLEPTSGVLPAVGRFAATDPARVAVSAPDRETTYHELYAMAGRVRRALLSAGRGHGEAVLVAGDRGAELIATFLALESCGAAYVPIDTGWLADRLAAPDEEQFIVETATTRSEKLGRPFTWWSIRKLADHLRVHSTRRVRIGRERLRQILHRHRITFQRTKTWKESTEPQRDAKLARIEYVSTHLPQRVFAFDEFGPLVIRPQPGAGGHPRATRAGCRRTTTSCTASGSSTAATPSATTSFGAWSDAARAPRTPSPRSSRSEQHVRTGRRST